MGLLEAREDFDKVPILNGWIEKGFSGESVCMFGTSIENLSRIVSSGKITPLQVKTNDLLEYQRQLTVDGRMLYYAAPLLERIRAFNENLASEIEKPFLTQHHGFSIAEIRKEFSVRAMMRKTRSYAIRRSMSDCFHAHTGLYTEADNILWLASTILPDLLNNYLSLPEMEKIHGDLNNIHSNAEADEVNKIRNQISLEMLIPSIAHSLRRRGVLLFFNKKILNANVIPGKEAETEIIILSESPLSTDTISGIRLLSGTDRKALFELLS